MSDLAHVPGERIQLHKGASLAEVFESALKRGGHEGEPREPLGDESVRSARELQTVIDEAGLAFADCGRLSVSLDWWNKNSEDPAWEVSGGSVSEN
ncbi:MAG TPA: hypothetical protein VGM44_24760 [Polyangiaceae bacterium]|jgi:hypothetical protein